MVVLFLSSSFRRQACQSVRVCHGCGDPFSGLSWLNFELHLFAKFPDSNWNSTQVARLHAAFCTEVLRSPPVAGWISAIMYAKMSNRVIFYARPRPFWPFKRVEFWVEFFELNIQPSIYEYGTNSLRGTSIVRKRARCRKPHNWKISRKSPWPPVRSYQQHNTPTAVDQALHQRA